MPPTAQAREVVICEILVEAERLYHRIPSNLRQERFARKHRLGAAGSVRGNQMMSAIFGRD